MNLPYDWYEEHSGQRLVLSSKKVADEIERLQGLVVMYRGAMDSIGRIVAANREITELGGSR